MSRPMRRFYFRLALALGYAHPDHLMAQLTSGQLAEWFAFYRLEPFGGWRDDYRSGILASTMANIFSKKGARKFLPTEFMPKFSSISGKDLNKKIRTILSAFKKD
jgi:hypothetical protein